MRLTRHFLERIEAYDRRGPHLNAVLEVNPEALEIAEALDRERASTGSRGPLHGIPVLLKDNIATADRLHTSAGSLALGECVAPRDAFLVTRLREAGAVILGKTNMTEWANFMTTEMPAGYSSRGGQAGADPGDRATRASRAHARPDYTASLDPRGLEGARVGVPRAVFFERLSAAEMPVVAAALRALRDAGATLVDPADIPTARAVTDFRSDVMLYEFKRGLNRYLTGLGAASPVKSLRDLIRFNEARPRETLRFGQVLLLAAQSTSGLGAPTYRVSRAEDLRLSRTEGLDPLMERERLDALVFPGWTGAAIGAKAGYPSIIVPAGYTADGAPLGLTLLGRAWSEPSLIRLAYAFEHATRHRRPPTSVA